MAVQLSSLRVTAEMDVSAYTRAMADKVAADTRGAASSRSVGEALAHTDAAAALTSGAMVKLSRQLLDGYSASARFEKAIRAIGDAVDRGMSLDRATVQLDAAYRKFGLLADSTDLARQGFVSIAPTVNNLNVHYAEQASAIEQATQKARELASIQAELAARNDRAAEAMERARAAQAAYNSALGVNQNDPYDPKRIEAWSDALQRATAVEARYLAGVRAEQEKLSAAAAAASQRTINTRLGVRDDFGTDARRRDIEAFGQALEREMAIEARYIAGQREMQAAQRASTQAAYNSALGVRDNFDTEKRQRDIEEFGRALERETQIEARYVASVRENEAKIAAARAATAQATINSNLGVRDDFNTASRSRDMEAFAASIEHTRERLDPLYLATKRYNEAVAEINANARAWGITEEYQQQLLLKHETVLRQTTQSLKNNTAELGLNTHGYTNLFYQGNDVATMWMSGASAGQIFATQAGQIVQVLSDGKGGVAGSLKAIGERLAGMITLSRLAGLGLSGLGVAGVVAFVQMMNAQEKLDASLQGLGASTKATVADLEAAAAASASTAGVSTGKARDMVAALASTGKIGVESYADITTAAKRYAGVIGKDLPDVTDKLAKLLADPAKAANELDDELNFLDSTTRRYINDLAISGKRQEAINVLTREMNRMLPDADRNLTGVGRAFKYVAEAADGMWAAVQRAVGSLGKAPSAADSTALQSSMIEALKERLANDNNLSSGERARLESELKQRQARIAKIEGDTKAAADKSTEAADRENGKVADAASRALDPRQEELDRLRKTQSDLRLGLYGKGGDKDQYLMDLEGVKNQIDAMTDANGKLKQQADVIRENAQAQAKVDSQTTESAKIAAQAQKTKTDAMKSGATEATAQAQADAVSLQGQIQLQTQLTIAARDRLMAAQDGIATAKNEQALIGKTAGEQATMNANLQARIAIQREAAVTGRNVDLDQLKTLEKLNEELGRQIDLRARLQLNDDISFESRQLGRTSDEQRTASELRSRGLAEDLNSPEAALIRMNNAMKDFKDTSKEALSGFANDLMNGTKLADALGNALNRVAARLADKAIDSALSGIFSVTGSGGGSAGGLFGSLLGGFGGGTVGATTGASIGLSGGGPVYGPGNGTSDSIPSWLSNGEFVVNAAATARNRSLLHAINDNRVGFATGGMVGNDAARSASSAVTTPITVNVINKAGASVTASQTTDASGNPRLDLTVDKVMATTAARPGSHTSRAFSGMFGIKQQGAQG